MNDWPKKGETLVRGTAYDALLELLRDARESVNAERSFCDYAPRCAVLTERLARIDAALQQK